MHIILNKENLTHYAHAFHMFIFDNCLFVNLFKISINLFQKKRLMIKPCCFLQAAKKKYANQGMKQGTNTYQTIGDTGKQKTITSKRNLTSPWREHHVPRPLIPQRRRHQVCIVNFVLLGKLYGLHSYSVCGEAITLI